MKTFIVTIGAEITIADPEYYSETHDRVIATLRSIDGSTNYRHETLILKKDGVDPLSEFLKIFAADPVSEAPDDPEQDAEADANDLTLAPKEVAIVNGDEKKNEAE